MEWGLVKLFNVYKLFIINLESVVFPTPNSPFNIKTSPALRFLQNFNARDLISEIPTIWFSIFCKFNYAIPLRASIKSVFSQVKCPSLVGSLPKCP